MLQVSYSATSPLFGNMIRYTRFYRTVPEVTRFFVPYAEVLQWLNWKKVAVIYYDDDFTLNVCGN